MPQKKPQKELSPEEMSELRQKTFDFYSDQVPLLEVQCKVEEFKARIAIAKFTAVEHKVKYMQLTHELNQAENKEDAKSKSDK